MEAMRLSMLDEEERRKKNEKEAKAAAKKEAKESKSKRRSSLQVDNSSAAEAGSSASAASPGERASTPRVSLDAARSSLDNARAVLSGKGKDKQGTSSRNSVESSNGYVGPASTSSMNAVSTKPTSSSFLKMPPMQRNDSSASMAQHDLPPPMVPAKAAPGEAIHRESANKPTTQRTYSDLLS